MMSPLKKEIDVASPFEWEDIYRRERERIFMSRIIRVYVVTLISTLLMYITIFTVKPNIFETPSGYIPRFVYLGSHCLGLFIAYNSRTIRGGLVSVFISIFLSTCAIEGILIMQPWHAMPKYVLFLVPILCALMLPVRLAEIIPISIGLPILHACMLPWHKTSDPTLEITLLIISGFFAIVSVQITDNLRKTNAIKEALLLREQSKFWSLQKQLEKFEEEVRASQIKEQSIQLGSLSQEIQELEQRERERIASLLHDHLQQHLAAAKIQTQLVRQEKDICAQNSAWEAFDEALANAIGVTRTITASVAPDPRIKRGLYPSLGTLKDQLEHRFGLKTEFILEKTEPKDPIIRSLLYDCSRELLFNAIKHSGVKKATLSLLFKEREYWHLRVSDQGKGYIQEEIIDKESLGLQILRRRIKKSGGTLEILSSLNNGVRIDIKIPVLPIHKTVTTPKSRAHSLKNRFLYAKIRVFIATENEVFHKEIKSIIDSVSDIEIVGHSIEEKEVIHHILEFNPDILLIDMNMTKRSGIELTRIMRKQTERIRVIGFSRSNSARIAQKFIASGGDIYLLESMLPTHLVNAIFTTKRIQDWILFRAELGGSNRLGPP